MWFVPNFLMIEWLLKVKPIIEQIIINPKWTTFVNMLRNTHWQKSFTKARNVWTNIKKDWFWDICANFVHMVELVLIALKVFNGKQPIMGKAWFVLKH